MLADASKMLKTMMANKPIYFFWIFNGSLL